jgi:hypothetical protein
MFSKDRYLDTHKYDQNKPSKIMQLTCVGHNCHDDLLPSYIVCQNKSKEFTTITHCELIPSQTMKLEKLYISCELRGMFSEHCYATYELSPLGTEESAFYQFDTATIRHPPPPPKYEPYVHKTDQGLAFGWWMLIMIIVIGVSICASIYAHQPVTSNHYGTSRW